MSALWILIIAVLGLLTVFLLLIIVLAVIMLKFGLVYTSPRFMRIILNLLTGELKEVTPGLRPIIPGVHKLIRMISCQPHVMGIEKINVVSCDGQIFNTAYQQTWWVDAFKERVEGEKEEITESPISEKKLELKNIVSQIISRAKKAGVELKEGRATKAATGISSEKEKEEETEEQVFERHASKNVKLETEATITSIIGSYNTETLQKQESCAIYCPECNKEIKGEGLKCSDEACRWGKAGIIISKDFKSRLSWLTTRLLDKSLSDRFGIGCETRISNIAPPESLQKALLDQQVSEVKKNIAEKKGEAVKITLTKEAEGYEKLKETGINTTWAYILGKAVDRLADLLEHLLKSPISKESHLKGGEIK